MRRRRRFVRWRLGFLDHLGFEELRHIRRKITVQPPRQAVHEQDVKNYDRNYAGCATTSVVGLDVTHSVSVVVSKEILFFEYQLY